MGFMRHDAIIVSAELAGYIEQVVQKAQELKLQVLGPSAKALNGVQSILICPDGSKEGWPESDDGDKRRGIFISYLRGLCFDDGSSPVDWIAVNFGEELPAKITAASEEPVQDTQ